VDTARNRLAAELEDEELSSFVSGLANLYCHDVQAAMHFYKDLLGFTETFRTPTIGVPEHVEVTLNGFKIGLSSVEAARRVHGVSAVPGSPAMTVTVWTYDTDRAFDRLVNEGVPIMQAPHDTANNNRAALLRDPDGNLVEIVAKVPTEASGGAPQLW